eukprot:4557418-Amphidinium_carterae.1
MVRSSNVCHWVICLALAVAASRQTSCALANQGMRPLPPWRLKGVTDSDWSTCNNIKDADCRAKLFRALEETGSLDSPLHLSTDSTTNMTYLLMEKPLKEPKRLIQWVALLVSGIEILRELVDKGISPSCADQRYDALFTVMEDSELPVLERQQMVRNLCMCGADVGQFLKVAECDRLNEACLHNFQDPTIRYWLETAAHLNTK